MSNDVLISIRPKWCAKEYTGEKHGELRKFSKEQIIEAITKCYQADYILDKILDDLEYAAQRELLDAHAAAIDARQKGK